MIQNENNLCVILKLDYGFSCLHKLWEVGVFVVDSLSYHLDDGACLPLLDAHIDRIS